MIGVEVPISGNVSHPEFNFSLAVRLAITISLTNILVAPFRLLDNVIGGDGGQR